MGNITIRNKRTGETKVIPIEQANQFIGNQGDQQDNPAIKVIQSRLQELQQPQQQQQQPQGDFMQRLLQSRVLPVGGAVLGAGVGTLAGPVTGVAGTAGGAMAGDVVRKELAGLLGKDIGEPGISTQKVTQQQRVESVVKTAKRGVEAAKAQLVGETIGFGLKFLKPGTVTSFLAKVNDILAKKTGFGKISKEVLETRFMNEALPKAMRFSQSTGEDVVETGGQLLEKKVQSVRIFDAEELNFLRKNLNAMGEGAEGMKKALLDGLAEIVRQEQMKLAPATGITLPLQRMAYKVPESLKAFWPTRMLLMGTDIAREFASGLMSRVAKYGGAPLIQGLSKKEQR